MLLLLADLDEMGQSVLTEFTDEVSQLDPTKGQEFIRRVERLEAKLEQLYAVAATIAQREEALENVAAIWSRMVTICDNSARIVSELREKYHMQESASHDRILDIRNECEENRALHA